MASDGEYTGRLSGKVCVVTGTGGSMGHATALVFAREGASVVGCDVTVEPAASTVEMVRRSGGEMVSMQPQPDNTAVEANNTIFVLIGSGAVIASVAAFFSLRKLKDDNARKS